MRLTIANVSKKITADDLKTVVRAIGWQVEDDFTPEWNIHATLRSVTLKLGGKSAPIEGLHDAIIYIGDSSQDPTTGVDGAIGYHTTNY